MEAMSAPLPCRPTSFLQPQTLRIPSLPIPIPARRTSANPPPRSPDREYLSSDLVFEMSPVAFEDAPVKGLRSHCPTVLGDAYHRKLYTPFSRLAACTGSPLESTGPYAREPFLYSIPKPPSRLSLAHRRSQSELVPPARLTSREISKENANEYTSAARHAAVSRQPFSNSMASAHDTQAYPPGGITTALTDAFQNSVSSGTSFATSTFPPSPVDNEGMCVRGTPAVPAKYDKLVSLLSTRRREDRIKGAYPTGISRTSAAAPVLSFAQVELGGEGARTREARVGRVKPKSPPGSSFAIRARSPYPLVRGRRNSVLRERGLRFSDDDISGTLKHDKLHEKFGLEKYLPTDMQKRNTKDENAINDSLIEKERGRTRSRARGGLRL